MNWDDMRLFLGLARNGRVAIAAKGLKVDPTTLIRRVKKLEDSLNCNLFELTKKGYVLTSQGSELVRYIEKAEHYFLEAQNELSDERSHLAGTIRVSVSEGFGSWFLAPLLPDFKAQYPGICIELVATSGFLNLNKREADMAILLEKPSKGLLVTQKLTDYELYLYTHETLVQSAKPKSLHDLRHFNLVSYVPDLVYAPQLKFIEETALSQLSALRSTSINAQHQMLVNGTASTFSGAADQIAQPGKSNSPTPFSTAFDPQGSPTQNASISPASIALGISAGGTVRISTLCGAGRPSAESQ